MASAPSAGCEALCALQTADTPHQRDCRGREASSTTIEFSGGRAVRCNNLLGKSMLGFVHQSNFFSQRLPYSKLRLLY